MRRPSVPARPNSTPSTRCSPARTCGGSPGLTPGVRALVLEVRNSALLNVRRPPDRSHLVPTSNARVFSGSSSTLAAASDNPSADGLNDVPAPAYTAPLGRGLKTAPARQLHMSSVRAYGVTTPVTAL